MRDTNAFAWYMEQDPLLRSTVVVVLVLEGTPHWDRLLDRLERVTRLSPGFRQKVVQPPLRLATPRWVVDPDFDLSWHIRRFEAAQPNTLATVLEFARKTGMAGLDRDRPLWELTFIEKLEGGQTAARDEAAPLVDRRRRGHGHRTAAVRRRAAACGSRTHARCARRREPGHRRPGPRCRGPRVVSARRLLDRRAHLGAGRRGERVAAPPRARSPKPSPPCSRSRVSSSPCPPRCRRS